jgi:hypothetical protein
MRRHVLAALLAAVLASACDGSTRGPCAAGGQVLGDCPEPVETPEDACWKLVDCGVIPLESMDQADWADCVDRFVVYQDSDQIDSVLACMDAASCDALQTQYPGMWPDCMEYP